MSRFSKGRNNAFFQQREGASDTESGNSSGAISKAFHAAKKTGIVSLSSRNIENVPGELFNDDTETVASSSAPINYSFDSRDGPAFWELLPIVKIDLSFNKISTLPAEINFLVDLAGT